MKWLALLLFVVLIVLLTLLLRYGILWMGRLVGQQTRTRFEEAESILNGKKIPQAWLEEARSLGPEPGRKKLLKRLRTLTDFFRTAPVVADETTREVMLESLAAVHEEWSKADWEELTKVSPDSAS